MPHLQQADQLSAALAPPATIRREGECCAWNGAVGLRCGNGEACPESGGRARGPCQSCLKWKSEAADPLVRCRQPASMASPPEPLARGQPFLYRLPTR